MVILFSFYRKENKSQRNWFVCPKSHSSLVAEEGFKVRSFWVQSVCSLGPKRMPLMKVCVCVCMCVSMCPFLCVCVCVWMCVCVCPFLPCRSLGRKGQGGSKATKVSWVGWKQVLLGEEFVLASQILCGILREHKRMWNQETETLKSWCLTFSKSFNSESALVLVL